MVSSFPHETSTKPPDLNESANDGIGTPAQEEQDATLCSVPEQMPPLVEEGIDCDTPRALNFIPKSLATTPALHRSTVVSQRAGLGWDESDAPTPRGSICLPSSSSESSELESTSVELAAKGSVKGLALEEVKSSPVCYDSNFPSPPPSPPLINPGGWLSERRIVVKPLSGLLSSSSHSSTSSSPSTSSSSSTCNSPRLLTPLVKADNNNPNDDTHPSPNQPLALFLATKTPLQQQQPPQTRNQPIQELTFDPVSNRYILPPTLSSHVSHIRWHLSRAYERRHGEEALKAAKIKVKGEVKGFERRWKGLSKDQKKRRTRKGKDLNEAQEEMLVRVAEETRDRIRALKEGVSEHLRILGSAPVPTTLVSDPEVTESTTFLKSEHAISPSCFLSMLYTSSSRETIEEVDVKLKLWEGWEWDIDVEWGLGFWKPRTDSDRSVLDRNPKADTDSTSAPLAKPVIHLPHLKRLKITTIDDLSLRPLFERIRVPLLEEVCIEVTMSSSSSSGSARTRDSDSEQRQWVSTRQAQKILRRCLEGDPWAALDLDLASRESDCSVQVEIRVPSKAQFDEKWVERLKALRYEGKVVRI